MLGIHLAMYIFKCLILVFIDSFSDIMAMVFLYFGLKQSNMNNL